MRIDQFWRYGDGRHDSVRVPLLMNKESRLQKASTKGIAEIL